MVMLFNLETFLLVSHMVMFTTSMTYRVEQELKKSVQDGIYYMTVLKGSISPTNGN